MSETDFLLQLRDAISKEPGLITHAFWDCEGNPCALGSLQPRQERLGSWQAFVQGNTFTASLWASVTSNLITDIATANNMFEGTPEERKVYMLQWIEKRLSNKLTQEVTQLPEVQLI